MATYDDKLEYDKRKAGGKDFINLVVIGKLQFFLRFSLHFLPESFVFQLMVDAPSALSCRTR